MGAVAAVSDKRQCAGRNCDAPRPISGRHCHIAHCRELRRRPARLQRRSRPTWAARSKRGPRPPRTAGAPGSSGHTGAPGAARSRCANPKHPCELRAAVLHRAMRAGRGACHSLLRNQKEAGDLPDGYFGVMRDHSESGRQSAGRSLREVNEPVMRPRCLIAPTPSGVTTICCARNQPAARHRSHVQSSLCDRSTSWSILDDVVDLRTSDSTILSEPSSSFR
jgi:hypothetical protein